MEGVFVIDNVEFKYNKDFVTIVDSYKITNPYTIEDMLYEFKKNTGYKSKRSIKSWTKEWKAHNRMYKLGLFRNHTKDCDLEENEKWWRLLIYEIIGR